MSKVLPWYKRNPKDFLDGTTHLSFEEKGAYSICLDLMYREGGPIPDDIRWVATQLNCSMQLWRKLRQGLIDHGKFTLTDDGRLANGRATYEMHISRVGRADQSRKGKLGGRPVGRPVKVDNPIPETAQPSIQEAEPAKKFQQSSNKVPTKLLLFEQETNDINVLNFTDGKPLKDLETQKKKKESVPTERRIARACQQKETELSPDQPQPKEEKTGPKQILWREGREILHRVSGQMTAQAGKTIGRLLKLADDDPTVVLAVLRAADQQRPGEVFPWLVKAVQKRMQTSSDAPVYRHVI